MASVIALGAFGLVIAAGLPPDLADHRSWAPMFKEPQPVPYELYIKCTVPTPEEWKQARKAHGPHSDHHIQVYANPLAATSLQRHDGKMPVGSIIAKDKLKDSTSKTSSGVAFMIKRSGGWEFLYFDAAGKKYSDPGSCAGCHSASSSDYVMGIYVEKP